MERLLFIIKTFEGMIYMNYWYEMLLRPVSIGCQPKGFVEVIEAEGRHGIVAYKRELTAEELDDYDMKAWTVLSK